MGKYLFCKDHDNATNIIKAGWVVEIADSDAAPLVKSGTVKKMPEKTPCKKGNLDKYNGCRPLDAAGIKAKQQKKEIETTITMTTEPFPDNGAGSDWTITPVNTVNA